MEPRRPDTSSPHCTVRILVVENDPAIRADHAENLARWSYQPVVAEGMAEALLEDARRKAREARCHVALIDMRLLDDYDRKDRSGLDLARELKQMIPGIVVIVVSGYGDRATAVAALHEIGAADFVGKEEGPARLREAIRKELGDTCTCDLHVDWFVNYYPMDILAKLRLSCADVPCDEPACVVRRLYRQEHISGVALEPIAKNYRPADRAPLVERSVVLVARAQSRAGHWHRGEMIKLALSDRIQQEVENYRQYVAPYLPNQRTARIEDRTNSSILWDIGAMRYTDIATEGRMPLRQWYVEASEAQLAALPDDLFVETLGGWYRSHTHSAPNFIYDYYTRCFPKLGQRLDDYAGQDATIVIPASGLRLRDPVQWAREHRYDSRFITRWDAFTHGDLHSENIFVDQFGQTSVIDYERSGPGYILRDFVELEVDIRLRLLPLTREQLPLAFQMDLMLLAPKRPEQTPVWRDPSGADEPALAELRKAFGMICRLRRLAFELTRFEGMEEYYWALLMETLISTVRQEPESDDPRLADLLKTRARLAAALLCERLTRWRSSWPPEEWRAAYDKAPEPSPGAGEQIEENMAHEVARLSRLREAHGERLEQLELQQANKGASTPPEIVSEIKMIRATIADLDRQMAAMTPLRRKQRGG